MFVGSGRVTIRGRRSWSNVCSGPIFGVDTVRYRSCCIQTEATAKAEQTGVHLRRGDCGPVNHLELIAILPSVPLVLHTLSMWRCRACQLPKELPPRLLSVAVVDIKLLQILYRPTPTCDDHSAFRTLSRSEYQIAELVVA